MDTLHDWLSLYLAPGLGPVLWNRLLAVFESPVNVLQAKSSDLRKVPGIGAKLAAGIDADHLRRAADAELLLASQKDTEILCLDDPRYPALLREIPDPPRILYVRGDESVLTLPGIAMVG